MIKRTFNLISVSLYNVVHDLSSVFQSSFSSSPVREDSTERR